MRVWVGGVIYRLGKLMQAVDVLHGCQVSPVSPDSVTSVTSRLAFLEASTVGLGSLREREADMIPC